MHLWIVFFAITMTWLFGGLHLAFGKLWLAIFFAIFDVFTVSIRVIYILLLLLQKNRVPFVCELL
jgi:hypothetical protein